jgi:hypothetical protein
MRGRDRNLVELTYLCSTSTLSNVGYALYGFTLIEGGRENRPMTQTFLELHYCVITDVLPNEQEDFNRYEINVNRRIGGSISPIDPTRVHKGVEYDRTDDP